MNKRKKIKIPKDSNLIKIFQKNKKDLLSLDKIIRRKQLNIETVEIALDVFESKLSKAIFHKEEKN